MAISRSKQNTRKHVKVSVHLFSEPILNWVRGGESKPSRLRDGRQCRWALVSVLLRGTQDWEFARTAKELRIVSDLLKCREGVGRE